MYNSRNGIKEFYAYVMDLSIFSFLLWSFLFYRERREEKEEEEEDVVVHLFISPYECVLTHH
jgi:hypothetical protein